MTTYYINGYANHSLGEIAADIGKAAGLTASAASALIAAGVSAQALPVIGQIAGTVLVLSGIIAKSRARSKAAKGDIANIQSAQNELRIQNAELDQMIGQAEQSKSTIVEELQRLGLSGASGLSGLKDWLKKTFTPGKYYEGVAKTEQEKLDALASEAETKISYLEQIQKELVALYTRLTTGTQTKNILKYLGITTVAGSLLYLLAKKLNWI